MRIAIVGCGYVGSALASHWHQQARHWLRVTTTRSERLAELAPLADDVRLLDAADPDQLRQVLETTEAAVFCLAPGGSRQVNADGYEATYLRSMEAVAAVMPQLPGLQQLVYTSSCSVYGEATGLVEETTPPQPFEPHARILRHAEELLLGCRAPHRRVAILRLGAIYGPGRELEPRFRSLAGSRRQGDGSSLISWIHRDDVVTALAWAVEQGFDGLLNLVDDEPISVRELVDRSCRAACLEPVIWEGDAASPAEGAAPATGRRISNRRLHQLGLELQHPKLAILAAPRCPGSESQPPS
ncbi:NAD-dependent epimerase/dehydratase family protein [Synechococcus sp. J7-Johnson]|uniref:NAD-dependent epimerase/dehydratase family protein n=1 Tax=Synechococcus sp. J7-Johnson TaxID=2823737 RepID=UPI0020CC6318|nr:NAD-dependent epimerase/dehydratase family protein [Synechococcus sp. J7-Johnson]MCP9841036.1 NAD-dependent epimerase/dehydratase family protein [Synechococcus sp. J7-Johnson]